MASTGLQHKSIEGSVALMVFRFGLFFKKALDMASTGLQHKSIEGSLALVVFRFGLFLKKALDMASTGLQHKSIEGSLALVVFRFGLFSKKALDMASTGLQHKSIEGSPALVVFRFGLFPWPARLCRIGSTPTALGSGTIHCLMHVLGKGCRFCGQFAILRDACSCSSFAHNFRAFAWHIHSTPECFP
jgi:hypothetical protein